MYFAECPDMLAEDFLLKYHPPTRWQKFLARFLGRDVFFGSFLPVGASGRINFYLIWCRVHRKHEVSYWHSDNQVTVCRDCEEERLDKINATRDEEFLRSIERQQTDQIGPF